ncbi:MAG: hypothetical protein Ct9H90mP20_5030 [Candidatus Neomarinimicrobiota bacterium]|nr:MAG: hypothetical protein Ct9H90mP20_5030 [Candidatus Neomarinimicrobiota bacterium]
MGKSDSLKRCYFWINSPYDRIIRCNEAAKFNHDNMGGFYYSDGRLVDPVDYYPTKSNKKSPMLAASLSALVPGSEELWR